MIKIEDVKELKFTITWRLLYRGNLKKQLKVDDIVEYAIEQLEKGNDTIEICELAGCCDSDLDDLLNILYELVNKENSQDEFEDRKLSAVIVSNCLKDKNDNCIDGLMKLTDLWIELGYPSDSPHIIQGQDSNISPMEYYTDDNYNYLYERNIKWLKNEITFLLAHQE